MLRRCLRVMNLVEMYVVFLNECEFYAQMNQNLQRNNFERPDYIVIITKIPNES